MIKQQCYIAFILAVWCSIAAMAAPSTKPSASTKPSTDEVKAIKSVLRAMVIAQDQGQPEDVAKTEYASNPEEQKILDSHVDEARSMRDLRKCILDHFGAAEASHFIASIPDVHAVDDELAKMPVTIKGNTALVDDGSEIIQLVKIGGAWRVPISTMLNGPPKQSAEQIIKYIHQNKAFIDETTKKVKAGEFKTVQDVSEHMKHILYTHQ